MNGLKEANMFKNVIFYYEVKPRQIGLYIGKSAKLVYDKCSGVVESYK